MFKGLDKLEKQLNQMEKAAKELDGTNEISFEELFTPNFMTKYTEFSSFEELLESGGFKVDSQADFEAIPDDEFDTHISTNTRFDSWSEMLEKATEVYITKKLGF